MKLLPLPFSPRYTLFCEGAPEHQRIMKKNNNLAEGDYHYLFLAVRVEVGAPIAPIIGLIGQWGVGTLTSSYVLAHV